MDEKESVVVKVLKLLNSHSTAVLTTYPVSASGWFKIMEGCAMCYDVYVIMHVKDLKLPVVRRGHCVLLEGFCLSLLACMC